ncbi:MAG: hypothetical protein ACK502_06110 [Alphaproteobacteria bacterium]
MPIQPVSPNDPNFHFAVVDHVERLAPIRTFAAAHAKKPSSGLSR